MQPLINLKQFLAVLLILIVPAALLTAYFRNYQPETGGAGHQHADAAGTHPAGGHGEMAMPAGGGDDAKQPPGGGQMDHSKMTGAAGGGKAQTGGGDAKQAPAGGEMDHSKMTEGAAQPGAAPAPDAKQLEASRAQLDASRAQLEASRQALEAAKGQPAPPEGQPPAPGGKPAEPAPPTDSERKPEAPKPGKAPGEHAH